MTETGQAGRYDAGVVRAGRWVGDGRADGDDGANGTTVGVTITNIYPQGKISVTKVIDAAGGDAAAGDQFTFTIDCPGDAYDQDIMLTAPDLGPTTSGFIPTGTQCTVTETGQAGGYGAGVVRRPTVGRRRTPPTVTVGADGTTVGVTVKNLYPQGKVSVTKVIDAAGGTRLPVISSRSRWTAPVRRTTRRSR